ncbi:MAG TPA: DegV family protein [Anaerolineae bacterium]|nr:DegV family protein [Caldilineae bacterium]HID32974.1 DegV family protein [Anaerolineae bacterium]HIQ12522.1 DegV family protein [Caldilineales bacterium]
MSSPRIGVVADSTCDFPSDWLYRDRLHIIPVHIHFQDETLQEGVDMTEDAFYARVLREGVIPQTSQPNPDEFATFYRRLKGQYDALISLHVTAKLSGTYRSALAGAEGVRDEIAVYPFDSGGGSAGAGFMADEAFRMIDAGASVQDILERLATLRQRIQILLSPNDLTFARMSGRVSALGAFMASMLHIVPIVVLTQGELIASERARSRKKALTKMVQMMQARLGDGPVNIAVVHAQAPDDLAFFRDLVLNAFHPQTFWITTLSISVASHLGPGTIGIVGYRTE